MSMHQHTFNQLNNRSKCCYAFHLLKYYFNLFVFKAFPIIKLNRSTRYVTENRQVLNIEMYISHMPG